MCERIPEEQRTPLPIYANLDKTPGQTVREWRMARKVTVAVLAERAGTLISTAYISQLETGRIKNPGDEYVRRLAEGLKISPGHILCRVGPSEADFEGEDSP